MRNPDYLSVAKAIFAERFPKAACAFVAGSITTGHGTPSSDIDLIVLFNDEITESYRESILQDGWPVELFIHNLKSQDYFFNEDIENGHSSTLTMVTTGILIGNNQEIGLARKEKAQQLLIHGPAPLTKEKIDSARYFITDLMDDLRHPKDKDYVPAILAQLFPRLGDFYLRSNNKWSGDGKQLLKLLKKENPSLTNQYLHAFEEAKNGKLDLLEKTVTEILTPFGGPLFEGYKSIANSWK